MQWNMAGVSKFDGSTGEPVDAIVRSVLNYFPRILTLNEVCRRQVQSLYDKLRASGYTMTYHFVPTIRAGGCGSSGSANDYGNAVFTRGSVIAFEPAIGLPNPEGKEPRNLVCMRTDLGTNSRIRACSTHLSPADSEPTNNHQQRDRVAEVMRGWANAGTAVAVGGDFNITPNALQHIYSTGTGLFKEIDYPENAATHSRGKIDYIFLTASRYPSLSGDATNSVSDHQLLKGSAYLN
jgi:endonuclease/exonuclease/phosphatase family metal-dependent hydrolase